MSIGTTGSAPPRSGYNPAVQGTEQKAAASKPDAKAAKKPSSHKAPADKSVTAQPLSPGSSNSNAPGAAPAPGKIQRSTSAKTSYRMPDPKLMAQMEKLPKLKPEDAAKIFAAVLEAGTWEARNELCKVLGKMEPEAVHKLLGAVITSGNDKARASAEKYLEGQVDHWSGNSSPNGPAQFLRSMAERVQNKEMAPEEFARTLTTMDPSTLAAAMMDMPSDRPEVARAFFGAVGDALLGAGSKLDGPAKEKLWRQLQKAFEESPGAAAAVFGQIASDPGGERAKGPESMAKKFLGELFDRGGPEWATRFAAYLHPDASDWLRSKGISDSATAKALDPGVTGAGKRATGNRGETALQMNAIARGTGGPKEFVDSLEKLSGWEIEDMLRNEKWQDIRDAFGKLAQSPALMKAAVEHLAKNSSPETKARLLDICASGIASGHFASAADRTAAADAMKTLLQSDPNGVLRSMRHEDMSRLVEQVLQGTQSLGVLGDILPKLSPENAAKLMRAIVDGAKHAGADVAAGTLGQALTRSISVSAEFGGAGGGFDPAPLADRQQAKTQNAMDRAVDDLRGNWAEILQSKAPDYMQRFGEALEPLF